MADPLEPLWLIFSRLKSDSALVSLVPSNRIANHLPQDGRLPWVRVSWNPGEDWGTKSSQGFDGRYTIDVWSDAHSDKEVLEIFRRIYQLLHESKFPVTVGGQSLLLRFLSSSVFKEPDGVSHHLNAVFRHIFTD